MKIERKCQQISNSYYNIGLEKAQRRDLSGAIDCLKNSLHFNKYHTDARNLLGLIYLEIGETSEALVQWVISTNLQHERNAAYHFLDAIQKKEGRLETISQTIRKYNQALVHAQNGSDDLAILQLTKVTEENPKFIRAQELLALLYIAHEEYTRAGKCLYKVLKIDKTNVKAQWYMAIVKENTGKAEVEKRKLKNAFSHRQMQDDDIIIPPTYKENTGWQTIINILIGVILGIVVILYPVMSARTRSLNSAHNQEMVSYSRLLNDKSLELDQMKEKLEQAEQKQEEAEKNLSELISDNGGILSQYQILIQVLQAYRDGDFVKVMQNYIQMDPSLITDQDVSTILDGIKADVHTNGAPVLTDLGNRSNLSGDAETALYYYQKALEIQPANPEVIYNMAVIYQKKEDKAKANELFGELIMNYGSSEYAVLAKEARGY